MLNWRVPDLWIAAAREAVPMTIAGALVFVTLGFASINLYTQVGLITLIGLVAKNGILIVDFANRMRDQEGMGLREAVESAAAIRLRPIPMTTVAMLVAMIPLLASGPGGGEPIPHRIGGIHRAWHRHAVYPVRDAGVLRSVGPAPATHTFHGWMSIRFPY